MKAVSGRLTETEESVDFRGSVGLTGGFSVPNSADESFNPGEEDDDIAEE